MTMAVSIALILCAVAVGLLIHSSSTSGTRQGDASGSTPTIVLGHGIVQLTQGNINNNHLYLADILDLFPKDAIGGASAADLAPQTVEVNYGPSDPVFTDIAGDKKIFRKRGWVGEFFKAHGLKAGDLVTVERIGSHSYRIRPTVNERS